MDLETVNKRKETLLAEKAQMVSAYDGAIQDCQYWIEQLTPKEDNGSNDKPD